MNYENLGIVLFSDGSMIYLKSTMANKLSNPTNQLSNQHNLKD